ncbi:TetR/AcrR family transcriptional regulator [Scopulibacillus cellulosilyticus]|uniref:TetR/AcrR family transcriptional regulator n=1 Tax=Scopulibacillus cellulosilyticus TaxID=2665665 RepID=A0ABW2PYX2_9BACL
MRGDANGRRDKILETAKKLFSEKGYHGVSIPDIAREAGVSVGSIYYIFKNKEDILLSLLAVVNSIYQQVFSHGNEMTNPVERLQYVIRGLYRSIDQVTDLFVILYKDLGTLDRDTCTKILNMESETARVIADIIRGGQQKGNFRHDIDADLLAFDVVSLGHMWALKKESRLHGWMSLEQYVESQLHFFMSLLIESEEVIVSCYLSKKRDDKHSL